jgi:hypothetical protein
MAKTPSATSTSVLDKYPPRKAKGRTLAEFLPLRACEEVLLEACRVGEFAVFNGCEWPEKQPEDEQDRLRPEFVRFLCLGGDKRAPVHEMGVQIMGGWIDGNLDLGCCNLPNDLNVKNSTINGNVLIEDTKCKGLYLSGSKIKSLEGARIVTKGSIHLDRFFCAKGKVCFVGAKIYGSLLFSQGFFQPDPDIHNNNIVAIQCDGAFISGSCFFNKKFHAIGGIRLNGVKIDGNLECDEGRFYNKGHKALICDGAVIAGTFSIEKIVEFDGIMSFVNMSVGAFIDDNTNYHIKKGHIYDGFRYEMFAGGSLTDAISRIIWLDNQRESHLTTDFRPQPWKYLIRTLRRMGHAAEADEVAIAFQDRRRWAGKLTGLLHPLHYLFGLLAGYGYRPMRLLMVMMCVWLGSGIIYQNAAENGWFAPTNPHLFQHERYAPCRPENGGNWVTCDVKTPPEYTTFNALAYSLDLILPLVELQQDKDWAPIVGKSEGAEVEWTFGALVRLVMWFEILFGWVASLLLVAVLTGLTNREGKDEG